MKREGVNAGINNEIRYIGAKIKYSTVYNMVAFRAQFLIRSKPRATKTGKMPRET
ncbi:MAG: hypothetical protein QXW47_07445 [Candidatus Jordarchaeales archaeon]